MMIALMVCSGPRPNECAVFEQKKRQGRDERRSLSGPQQLSRFESRESATVAGRAVSTTTRWAALLGREADARPELSVLAPTDRLARGLVPSRKKSERRGGGREILCRMGRTYVHQASWGVGARSASERRAAARSARATAQRRGERPSARAAALPASRADGSSARLSYPVTRSAGRQ